MPQLRAGPTARTPARAAPSAPGVLAARAPIVVTLDGDGQNDPADAPRCRPTAGAGPPELAMVGGERVKRQDSLAKRLASQRRQRHAQAAAEGQGPTTPAAG